MIPATLIQGFWKPALIALVLIGLIIAGKLYINSIERAAFQAGKQASEQRHREALYRANAENRERERRLGSTSACRCRPFVSLG